MGVGEGKEDERVGVWGGGGGMTHGLDGKERWQGGRRQ